MWLEKVTLTNLFCYHEEVTFEFGLPAGAGDPKHIAIVWGRNGYGKTSFLTGMKLLVGGVYDKLRETVLNGRKLSVSQYLLGWGDEWSGIVNSLAWRKARTDIRVAVSAIWHDAKNGRVRIEREWTIAKKTQEYQESLTITGADGRAWVNDEATIYLSTIFPTDYIDFVMYDGEQIQELADSNEQTRIDAMEKLLEIRPLHQLRQNLKTARTSWNHVANVRDAKNEFAEFDARHRTLEAQLVTLQGKLEGATEERTRLEAEKERLDAEIRQIQESSPTEDRARLIERRQRLKQELDSGLATIAVIYLADAPLLFNRAVVHETASALHVDREDAAQRAQHDQLTQLQEELPIQVFDLGRHSQPPLTDAQKRFYKDKLQKQLDGHKSDQPAGRFTLDLTPVVREQIYKKLQRFADDDNMRRERLSFLRGYLDQRAELREAEAKLNDLSDLTVEKQKQANDLRNQAAEKDREIKEKSELIGHLGSQIRSCQKEIGNSNEGLERQREVVDLAVRYSRRSKMAENLLTFVDEFTREVKKTRRAALEEKINEHCGQLLSSNALIKRVKLDENFRMTYHSEGGVLIGKKNMSAGMRQLLATALLWALAEESGLELPVIVDTPLARLDREHQAVLLREYFAKASHQMILLPTDSEIDDEKFKFIQPFVYLEHVLKNDEGNAAMLIRKSTRERRQK